jgi:oligopeptide transport system ATP-binding protein
VTAASSRAALLDVRGLRAEFQVGNRSLTAVDGTSFTVHEGETLCLVGESGCGKSVTALSIMGLLPSPPARVTAGKVLFDGVDLLTLSASDMRAIRGKDIGMIFQDPMTSLNPALTIGRQLTETMTRHLAIGRRGATDRAVELLHLVGIPAARDRLGDFPHQFSGGMRQRVMIAIALSCEPRLLIADEPTTALDVTIQAQILDLLRRLTDELGMAMILITHDMGVVAGMADGVSVMYAGHIVERGAVDEVFANPRHPYTRGLIRSIPRVDSLRQPRLHAIDGMPPNLINPPPGCPFEPRCEFAQAECVLRRPPLAPISESSLHEIACFVDVTGRGESGRTPARPEELSA